MVALAPTMRKKWFYELPDGKLFANSNSPVSHIQ